jgi:2,3-bisphosphoglycerate-independent phosphoglycerate mutase
MVNPQTGEKITEHSVYPVPFYLVGKEYRFKESKTEKELEDLYKTPQGILSDIAPTILAIIKISQPSSMTGKSLLDIIT